MAKNNNKSTSGYWP